MVGPVPRCPATGLRTGQGRGTSTTLLQVIRPIYARSWYHIRSGVKEARRGRSRTSGRRRGRTEMGTMTMELLILVLAIPSAYLVARYTYRMHHRVAALLSVDSARGRRAPVDSAGGAAAPVESAPGPVASPGSV